MDESNSSKDLHELFLIYQSRVKFFPKCLRGRYETTFQMINSQYLMIFDEPSLGLSPILVQNLFKLIKRLNTEGISILLVEQNAHLSLQFSNRGYVLEKGRVVLSGLSKELLNNSFVKKAFLGL